jgi:two-component system, cell cycle sensor histidine kinase and response regulator CckA
MAQTPFSRPVRRVPGDPQLRLRDEKLESLKAVAGKLAHDFNNFLVPQFGYLTLLKEELPANSTSQEYAARMEATGRKTESYVESILLGMRPHRQFAPIEFSLSALVESALDSWSAEIPPGAEISIHREIDACAMVGDERQWKCAVQHLLANARYALATGGRLEITLKKVSLGGPDVVRLGLDSAEVHQLVVRDNGFGMSPETAARAFEPFFTTRTQIKAAGLGLTIVHAVTLIHAGQIELESAEDKGTAVTLWIPPQGAPRERFTASDRKGTSTPKRKVLLIEDDPLINEVLRDWLGRFDFDVQVATTAEEAGREFARRRAEWSLVIIETDLRGAPGETVYAELRALEPALPWIFLAGRRKPEFTMDAIYSAPLIMQKPVTLRTLAEVVAKHAIRN